MKPTQPVDPPPSWLLKRSRNAGLITRELEKMKRLKDEAVEQTLKEFDRNFNEGDKGFDRGDNGFNEGDKGFVRGDKGFDKGDK